MDGLHNLLEITECIDCYRHSNMCDEPDWFTKPCSKRHELVFAKAKGYCFWPAKVLNIVGNQYEVRFFGHTHDRAFIDATQIRPIDTEPKLLRFKKTQALNKAFKELEAYKNQLQLSLLPKMVPNDCSTQLAFSSNAIKTHPKNEIAKLSKIRPRHLRNTVCRENYSTSTASIKCSTSTTKVRSREKRHRAVHMDDKVYNDQIASAHLQDKNNDTLTIQPKLVSNVCIQFENISISTMPPPNTFQTSPENAIAKLSKIRPRHLRNTFYSDNYSTSSTSIQCDTVVQNSNIIFQPSEKRQRTVHMDDKVYNDQIASTQLEDNSNDKIAIQPKIDSNECIPLENISSSTNPPLVSDSIKTSPENANFIIQPEKKRKHSTDEQEYVYFVVCS